MMTMKRSKRKKKNKKMSKVEKGGGRKIIITSIKNILRKTKKNYKQISIVSPS